MSLYDWLYNAATGTTSPGQNAALAGDTYVSMQQAGASDQSAMDAANEVYNYAPTYYPAQSPFAAIGSDIPQSDLSGFHLPDVTGAAGSISLLLLVIVAIFIVQLLRGK